MEAINLSELVQECYENREILNEGICGNHIKHLYEDYKMTFSEMKSILKEVFSGKTTLTEKVDGLGLMVTYKNGNFCFARNKSQLKEPMNMDKLTKFFNGDNLLREAFVQSANDLTQALSNIDCKNLNRLFANGQNFANVSIIYPPVKNVIDYGNKCLIQMNSVDVYDHNFNKIQEDKEASKWLYETLKNHKALTCEMFEITQPNVLRMRNSISAEKALTELMEDFDKVIDGYSTKCSIQDYANERLRRCIINACNHNGIEVDRDCQFVKEMADRLGRFSCRRPTKSDICTFAKRAGVNVRSEEYRNLMETLEKNRDAINEEVMRPLENLVMKAGCMLFRNLTGFMASDPNKMSQKLVTEIENAINEVEKDDCRLTPDKLKIFKKHVRKINEWQDKYCPAQGVLIKLSNRKVYKVNGAFGPCSQILRLFGMKDK